MSREGLREDKPLPSSVGRAERSPKVDTSDSQKGIISQSVYQ